MHVTLDKPHEPAVSVRIAGHVLCHRTASCHPVKYLIIAAPVSLAAVPVGALRLLLAGCCVPEPLVPVTCVDHLWCADGEEQRGAQQVM
jgi:hypothetical protein